MTLKKEFVDVEGYTTRTDMTEWTAHRGRTAASTGCCRCHVVPMIEAGVAAWSMLTAPHFGLAWSAGATALVLGTIATALENQL